jgi:hypothetical protein
MWLLDKFYFSCISMTQMLYYWFFFLSILNLCSMCVIGIRLDRRDLEVLFQATLGIHLLRSLSMMLQVCHLNMLSFHLFFYWQFIFSCRFCIIIIYQQSPWVFHFPDGSWLKYWLEEFWVCNSLFFSSKTYEGRVILMRNIYVAYK